MHSETLRLFPEPSPLTLPDFTTLCISGNYPPSSPLHLCISQAKSSVQDGRRRVILVTKSREDLIGQLSRFNDAWLNTNSGLGEYAEALANIVIVYCPTITKWLSFFTSLHISRDPSLQLCSSGALSTVPSMIVLHEPSALLSESESSSGALTDHRSVTKQYTFSTYLFMIIRALSASSELSTSSQVIKVVLFDSNIANLRLPVIKSHSSIFGSDDTEEITRKEEPVLPAIQKYFEWFGTCEMDGRRKIRCTASIDVDKDWQPKFIFATNRNQWTQTLVKRDEPSPPSSLFLFVKVLSNISTKIR